MAASGALDSFLSTMLGLRAQRLQEQEAKARAQEELMSGIGKGLGSVMQGLGTGLEKGRKDAAVNQMMNQMMPPSATAVDPAMQAKFTGRTGAPFTGGQAGLDALKDIMALGKGDKEDIWKALNYNLARRRLNLDVGKASEAAAAAKTANQNKIFEGMSKSAQDIVKDSDAYRKSSREFLGDMTKALEANNGKGDFAAWQVAADNLASVNDMAKGRKLTTALVDTPPFFPPAQQKLLDTYTAAQQAAKGAPATSGLLGRPSPEARALEEAGTEATGVAVPYPGGKPRYAPPTTPLDPGMVNRLAGGAQATPQEAQQLGAPYPGAGPTAAGGGGPTAAGGGPSPVRAAPGAPLRNPNTGQIWDPKTNKILNPKTNQWENR